MMLWYHDVTISNGGEIIKSVPIRLDDDLHKKLKLICVYEDTSIQQIAVTLLKDYADQYHKQNQK